jgi:4-amino-4-deoxy-L-arabinose transferase-like glycosyltransferase
VTAGLGHFQANRHRPLFHPLSLFFHFFPFPLSRLCSFFLLIISIFAGWTLWYVTPAGLGLTNDSAAYIGGARSILAGTGYSDIWLDSTREPITHYPPLLSLVLSAIGLLTGLDPYRAARALHIVLSAANTGLIGFLGWRMTRWQPAALLLALLFAANAQLLRIHAYVLSEPLFIFFSLLSFLSFDFAIEQRASAKNISGALKAGYWSLITYNWSLLTGFLTGLAFLTRYSGLALIATFLAAIFLFQPDWRSRFVKTGQFLAGALLPAAVWFIRNAIVAESATNRVFRYNPIPLPNIRQGLRNFSQFLTPFQSWRDWLFESGILSAMLIGIGLVLLAWLIFQATRVLFQSSNHQTTQSPNPLAFTTALYVFGYLGAVLFSMSFFDASTKFQHRILSPLYISWMILLVYGLHKLHGKTRFFSYFGFGLAAISLVFTTYQLQVTLPELHDSAGLGYGSWKWRQSIIMARLKDLPAGVAIYTNSPPAVYHVTGRASRVLPSPVNPVSGQVRGSYQQDLAQLRADLLAGRAVLALFNTTDIEDALGVENLEDFSSGLTVLEKAQGDILYGKP